jgi:regulator of protease activity HflC (stomatin/prohibitin superfamily)
MVVERLGKLHSIHESGWFIAVPVLDKIAYRVDMRERSIVIDPQSAITKDNVSVEVSGNLYVQFVDPEKAAYGSKNPLYSVRQFAQSSMRSAIGELELDEILHARAALNRMISASVQDAAESWGLHVKRCVVLQSDDRSP